MKGALAAAILSGLAAPVGGADARLWFGASATTPGDPDAPVFVSAEGIARQYHIWVQPRTTNAGAWDPVTNPFLTFENIALNVVSPQTSFTIETSSILVANPTYSTTRPRFEYVGDSTSGLTETTGGLPGDYDDPPAGFAKGLLDLQGFRIDTTEADGLGPTADVTDLDVGTTVSGEPAWRFASFTVEPTASVGTVSFSLQIGRNGMKHIGETASDMRVEFGLDKLGLQPASYNPDVDRSLTFADDDPDLMLTLAGPGDYNGDGLVDDDDHEVWSALFGSYVYDADGNGDGLVDVADYTVWRDHVPVPAALVAVPETSSSWLIAGGAIVLALIKRRQPDELRSQTISRG